MKPRHVYRPPRNNRLLSTAIIFGGGAMFTFLVFFLIPLMQKLEQGLKEEEEDLTANLVVAPEEEYIAPEEEPEPEEEEPEPEMAETEDEIAIEPLDLPDLAAGMGGKVLLNITPGVALGGGGDEMGAGGVDSEPVPSSTASPTVPNSVKKQLAKMGSVRVLVAGMVDESGVVTETSIAQSSGIPALDQAAMNALKRYKFRPAIRNGRKARARVKLPFDFRVR
ncbi:energy transducer TonB [Verrucomicrobiaceae bacterium 227]